MCNAVGVKLPVNKYVGSKEQGMRMQWEGTRKGMYRAVVLENFSQGSHSDKPPSDTLLEVIS